MPVSKGAAYAIGDVTTIVAARIAPMLACMTEPTCYSTSTDLEDDLEDSRKQVDRRANAAH